MLRNTIVPEVGARVVVCHVPEVDLYEGHYTMHTVAEVWPDGQVILDDGWRTGIGACWPSLAALRDAVRDAYRLADIDQRMLRNAL